MEWGSKEICVTMIALAAVSAIILLDCALVLMAFMDITVVNSLSTQTLIRSKIDVSCCSHDAHTNS